MRKRKVVVPEMVLEYVANLALTSKQYSDDEVLFDFVEVASVYPRFICKIIRAVQIHLCRLLPEIERKVLDMRHRQAYLAKIRSPASRPT